MDYQQFVEIIHMGNYNSELNKLESLKNNQYATFAALSGRILELNGQFEEGLKIVQNTLMRNTKDKIDNENKLLLLISKSYCLWRLSRFSEGLETIENAENILKSIKLTTPLLDELQASLQNICGLIHWKEMRLDIALIKFRNGLHIRKRVDNLCDIAYSLNNIGNTYLLMKKLELAFRNYLEAMEIRKKIGYDPGLASSYNSFGRFYDQKKEYKTANKYYLTSLNIWKKVGNNQFIAKSYRFLGLNYMFQNKYEQALMNYQLSIDLFQEIGNKIDLNVTKNLIEQTIN